MKHIINIYMAIVLVLTTGGSAFAYQAYDYNYSYYQPPYGTNSRYISGTDNRYYSDYYYQDNYRNNVMRDPYTGKSYQYYFDGYVTHYKKIDKNIAYNYYPYSTTYPYYYQDYTQSRRTTGGPYYENDLHFDPVTGQYVNDPAYKTPAVTTASKYKNAYETPYAYQYTYYPYDRPYYDSRYYDSTYYDRHQYDRTYNSYYDPYSGYSYYY